jgi:hypothetical protein
MGLILGRHRSFLYTGVPQLTDPPNQSLIKQTQGSFLKGQAPDIKLTIYLYPIPKLKINNTIAPLQCLNGAVLNHSLGKVYLYIFNIKICSTTGSVHYLGLPVYVISQQNVKFLIANA